MRNRVTDVTAALLLASATWRWRRRKPAEATPAHDRRAATGTVDFGFRITDGRVTRPASSGIATCATACTPTSCSAKQTDTTCSTSTAKNIGYRDQNYALDYQNSRVKFSFIWDSIPLNYCYNCLDAVARKRRPNVLDARRCGPAAGAEQPLQNRAPVDAAAARLRRDPDHGRAGAAAVDVPRPRRRRSRSSSARDTAGFKFELRHDHGRRPERRLHEHQEVGQPALRHVLRVQQRERAADAARQPHERLRRRPSSG